MVNDSETILKYSELLYNTLLGVQNALLRKSAELHFKKMLSSSLTPIFL